MLTHRSLSAQKLLHRVALTQRNLYTQRLLHREVFYAEKSLHRGAFIHAADGA